MNRQLIIRGTDAQIVQIRELLGKLGEHLDSGDVSQGGHLRTLPMSEASARAAPGAYRRGLGHHAAEQDSHRQSAGRQRTDAGERTRRRVAAGSAHPAAPGGIVVRTATPAAPV